MPTGYTYSIIENDGISFEDFVLQCATAFLVSCRENPIRDKIPERVEEDTYYKNAFEEVTTRLERYRNMSIEEANVLAHQEYLDRIEKQKQNFEKTTEEIQQFNAMLNKVIAWNPPSETHEGLKKFMIEQIQTSIPNLNDYNEAISELSGSKYLKIKMECALEDINYSKKKWDEEKERVKKTNIWITQLRDNLRDK
jgi:hypothetical protein